MKTMVSLIMSNGRTKAAASFEVDLRWCAMSVENAEKMRHFRPHYLCDITMSDMRGHYRYCTTERHGLKGVPKSRGSKLATKRRRTVATRSF